MFPEDLEASKSKCSAKTRKVRSLSSQIKQIKKEWGDPTALSEESRNRIQSLRRHGCRTPDKHSLPSSANLVRCTSRSHSPRGSIFVCIFCAFTVSILKGSQCRDRWSWRSAFSNYTRTDLSMVVQYLSNIGIHFKSFSWIFRVCVSQKNLHRKVLEPFTVSGVSDSILAKLLCLCVYAGIRVDTLCLPTKNRRLFWTTGIVAIGNAFLFWFPSLSSLEDVWSLNLVGTCCRCSHVVLTSEQAQPCWWPGVLKYK